MVQLATAANLKVNFSVSYEKFGVFYDPNTGQPYLTISVIYLEAMQNEIIRVDLVPSLTGIFSKMPPANVTLTAVPSNAYPLLLYT